MLLTKAHRYVKCTYICRTCTSHYISLTPVKVKGVLTRVSFLSTKKIAPIVVILQVWAWNYIVELGGPSPQSNNSVKMTKGLHKDIDIFCIILNISNFIPQWGSLKWFTQRHPACLLNLSKSRIRWPCTTSSMYWMKWNVWLLKIPTLKKKKNWYIQVGTLYYLNIYVVFVREYVISGILKQLFLGKYKLGWNSCWQKEETAY
jgi:hypothetical protein